MVVVTLAEEMPTAETESNSSFSEGGLVATVGLASGAALALALGDALALGAATTALGCASAVPCAVWPAPGAAVGALCASARAGTPNADAPTAARHPARPHGTSPHTGPLRQTALCRGFSTVHCDGALARSRAHVKRSLGAVPRSPTGAYSAQNTGAWAQKTGALTEQADRAFEPVAFVRPDASRPARVG
jgi:hypothetical protein